MSEAATRPARESFLRKALRWAVFVVVMIAGFAAWDHLREGGEAIEVAVVPGAGWTTAVAAACMGVGLLLQHTRLLDRLPWHGVLPAPYDAGLAWTHSVAYRLVILLVGVGFFGLGITVAGMAFQAWLLADWDRLAIAALFTLPAVGGGLMVVSLAFMRGPVMGFDPDGLEDDDHRLEWVEIEKIGVARRLSDRRVSLFLVAGHPLGPVHTFSLKEVGLTAGQFMDKVEAIAPQVRIERPEPRRPRPTKA